MILKGAELPNAMLLWYDSIPKSPAPFQNPDTAEKNHSNVEYLNDNYSEDSNKLRYRKFVREHNRPFSDKGPNWERSGVRTWWKSRKNPFSNIFAFLLSKHSDLSLKLNKDRTVCCQTRMRPCKVQVCNISHQWQQGLKSSFSLLQRASRLYQNIFAWRYC